MVQTKQNREGRPDQGQKDSLEILVLAKVGKQHHLPANPQGSSIGILKAESSLALQGWSWTERQGKKNTGAVRCENEKGYSETGRQSGQKDDTGNGMRTEQLAPERKCEEWEVREQPQGLRQPSQQLSFLAILPLLCTQTSEAHFKITVRILKSHLFQLYRCADEFLSIGPKPRSIWEEGNLD